MKTFPVRTDRWTNGEIASLEGVKVGDKFLTRDPFGRVDRMSIVQCVKVTPTIAYIGGFRYRIATAQPFGGGQWSRAGSLFNATPDALADIERENEHQGRVVTLRSMPWPRLPRDFVQRVHDEAKRLLAEAGVS